MPPATATLFVYGTLMSSATSPTGRAQRARLGREARLVGPATASGHLYDLDRYPGLVLSAAPDALVHGEAWELADPARSFRWLDAYEGIVPGDHPHNPYARVVRPVTLAGGALVDAYLYAWQRDTSGKPLIADGRWR